MSKIQLSEIGSITVHWSENEHFYHALGEDENGDIEKTVSPTEFAALVEEASKKVSGYDKTCLTVTKNSGLIWAKESKFYLHKGDDLYMLLNRGE